jgi:hypothetical protein
MTGLRLGVFLSPPSFPFVLTVPKMPSPNPLPVPTVPSSNMTPALQGERLPSPEASYFSLRPPAQPQSSAPGDFPGSPSPIQRTDTGISSNSSNLLRTPPGPESQSRQDPSYFKPRHSHSRQTRTTSPSEHLPNPTCFSPGLSSSGSFHSSDFGHSGCSYSSSEFLTPPQGQPDTDNPPYKARQPSSESLTMARKLRKANTMPHDKEHKRKRRHRKHHKCGQKKVKLYQHQNRSYWWLPSGCQVAPTAPRGQKQLCEGHAGHYTPKKTRYGNIDTYGRLPPDLRSNPAPAVVTRRWSSVEIGAHQIMLESTLPLKPTTPQIRTSGSLVDDFVPRMLSKPYRSSTFTRGAIDHDRDHDIVRTVRTRLTLRMVPGEKLNTPESITLRRASGEGPGARQSDETGEATPRARYHNTEKKRYSAAYLITAEDIDSITELIEANLRRNYDSYGNYDRHAYSTPPSQQTTPTSGVTGRTVVPSNGYVNQSAAAMTELLPTCPKSRSPLNYLQVVPEGKTKNGTIPRTDSQKSVHEVIWESGGSPRSLSSIADEDDPKHSVPCGSEPSTPSKITFQTSPAFRPDKGDAFDPKNANASISEWSGRCPHNDIAVVLTSSDSDSNDVLLEGSTYSGPPKPGIGPEMQAPKATPRTRARPPLRSAISETELQDVVSFPPLTPRKKTNDWYSPLPPMEMDMSPPLSTRRSLYDIGIDVSFGPSSSKTVTPKSSRTSWVRSTQVSPSRSIEFDPNYEIRCKSPRPHLEDYERRKSVIKAHPNATAHIGDISTAGSSLGTTSHVKRKSSTPSVQRPRSRRICESAAVRALISTTSGGRQSSPSRVRTSPPAEYAVTRPNRGVNTGERNSPPTLWARPEPGPSFSERIPESSSEGSHLDERSTSSTPRLPRVRTIDNVHKGEHEAPPSKWRAPSPCPSPRPPSPSEYASEYEDARESLPNNPNPSADSTQIKATWADRLSLIRLKSPPLPAVDRIGIYGRMTGGQRRPRGDPCGETVGTEPHVCDSCPKPSEPHVCDDCAKDPRTPSIDWIG